MQKFALDEMADEMQSPKLQNIQKGTPQDKDKKRGGGELIGEFNISAADFKFLT